LQKGLLGKNDLAQKIVFFTPAAGGPPLPKGTWTKHENLDLPGYGDVEQYGNWKTRIPIEGL